MTNTVLRDIAYCPPAPHAKPHSQQLDLYLPPPDTPCSIPAPTTSSSSPSSSPPPPLVVFVHGGLWMDRDKADYSQLGLHFASLGLPCAVLNYRQTSHEDNDPSSVQHPLHTQDVAQAVQYLTANSSLITLFASSSPSPSPDSPLYDPARLILAGHSCGAHMIALLTTASPPHFSTPPSPPPFPLSSILCCVGLQGLYDVESYVAAHPDWSADLYRVFERWNDPVVDTTTSSLPTPWLVVHSAEDQWVEKQQPEQWVEQLRRVKGGRVQYEVIEKGGGGHWEVVSSIGTSNDVVTARVLAFLQRIP